tara:strand:- start:9097 stop:9858 length:762 start_codon:yes stop_codon:yes gene_type:complete
MCLAIYKAKGAQVPYNHLKNAFERNPHGAGFAYVNPKDKHQKVHIRKGFFTFDEFMDAYRPHSHKACAIHFRFATKGAKTKENCHPFKLTKKHAMIHNGTMQRVLCKNGGSDSSNFADRILGPIIQQNPNFIHTKHGQKIINLAIGESKVVVLDHTGSATIFNEHKGHWKGDIWYSNETYKARIGFTTPKRRKVLSKPKSYIDYHASNRGKGRSYIDDLEESSVVNQILGQQTQMDFDEDGYQIVDENGETIS